MHRIVRRSARFVVVAIAILLLISPAVSQFINVTAGCGIYVPPAQPTRGAAWADFDGDGDLDLFAPGGAGNPIWIFWNDGLGNFTSTIVHAAVNLAHRGCAAADFDRDGDTDVLVAIDFGLSNLLFVNDGTGTFTEEAGTRGLGTSYGSNHSVTVSWSDFDRDGWLDVFVGDFDLPPAGPTPLPMLVSPNTLFLNMRDGTFNDVTALSGITGAGFTYGSIWHDFDHDGWPDLFISNDRATASLHPCQLYRNNRNLTFNDLAPAWHAAAYVNGMGVTIGDIENDGDWDVYITDTAGPALLVWDQSLGTFTPPPNGDWHATAAAWGLGNPYVGWGCHFFDYDRDGLLDLAALHGNGPGLLYNGSPTGFIDVSGPSGFSAAAPSGHGSCLVDYDGDGDLDVYLAGSFFPAQLIENTSTSGGWLRIDATGTLSNPDAKGLQIIATSALGTQRRMVTSGEGFLCDGDDRIYLGFGADPVVQEIELRWPSGTVNYMTNVPLNQTLSVVEPTFSVSGPMTPGSANLITFNAGEDAGRLYLCGFGINPLGEIYLPDMRSIRLAPSDPIFQATIVPNNPWLLGNYGVMTPTGGVMIFPVPPIPGLTGYPFHFVGLTLDAMMPGYIRTIHGPQKIVIQ